MTPLPLSIIIFFGIAMATIVIFCAAVSLVHAIKDHRNTNTD